MQIHPLQEHLQHLTGSTTHIGKGGTWGEVDKQVDALRKAEEGVSQAHELTQLSTIPKLELALQKLEQQLGAQPVQPKPVSAGEAAGAQELLALKAQRGEQEAIGRIVAERQTLTLQGLPPSLFGGSFQEGGIVPGPPGSPKIIEAHGGETVLKAGAPQVHVNFSGELGWLRDMVRYEIREAGRDTARTAGRRLPGAGGGLLVG